MSKKKVNLFASQNSPPFCTSPPLPYPSFPPYTRKERIFGKEETNTTENPVYKRGLACTHPFFPHITIILLQLLTAGRCPHRPHNWGVPLAARADCWNYSYSTDDYCLLFPYFRRNADQLYILNFNVTPNKFFGNADSVFRQLSPHSRYWAELFLRMSEGIKSTYTRPELEIWRHSHRGWEEAMHYRLLFTYLSSSVAFFRELVAFCSSIVTLQYITIGTICLLELSFSSAKFYIHRWTSFGKNGRDHWHLHWNFTLPSHYLVNGT